VLRVDPPSPRLRRDKESDGGNFGFYFDFKWQEKLTVMFFVGSGSGTTQYNSRRGTEWRVFNVIGEGKGRRVLRELR
jgi:hypothetical protein